MTTVILDYGHGGMIRGAYQTPGKRYTFDDGLTIYEGVINRRVAAKLATLLKAKGIGVLDALTGRPFCHGAMEQTDVPLAIRVRNANEAHKLGPTLYVSIHSNAAGDASYGKGHPARGIDVYTSVGLTSSDSAATHIYNACKDHALNVRSGDWQDGDADHERNFFVLRRTTGPAVLIEGLFFTNREDAEILFGEGPTLLAEAYAEGIASYLNETL